MKFATFKKSLKHAQELRKLENENFVKRREEINLNTKKGLMNFKQKIILWLDKKFERKDGKIDYCTASPDVVCGVDIGYRACRWHDKDYAEKKISRKQADLDFKSNIQYAFKVVGKPVRGFFISWVYFLAVRIFGGPNWEN